MTETRRGKDHLYRILRILYMPSQLKEEERENILFAPYGETSTSFRCLLYLLRHKEGVEPSKMADRIKILRQSATGMADQFEKKNYITRQTHPKDRRKVLLVITPEGEKVAKQLTSVFWNYHSRVSEHFTPEEMQLYGELRSRMQHVRDDVIKQIVVERDKG